MTKQGNFTQRTPQAKKQSDQASRQISKQASGSANTPYDLVFTAMGPPLGTTQTTATITSAEGLQHATFTTPPQTVPGTNTTEPPPPPLRNKGPELGADNLTLEGVATELAPSDFVSQNYETLVALMQEETKKRSSQSLQARLNFGPEDEVSPPRHQKERRGKDNRRPPVFGRIGKKVSGTQTANLQNLDTHENNDWRISVRDRLGSRDVHSRLGQRRSPSESPPSSDSEDSRRKRRRRVSSSSEDSSDNEDAETGHWKSKNKYREDEDEDMSRPWRRQKVDAFTRRISDFSEDKKRRMPANVKTYDGTGDPDDHLKIFESAATIENWPQPVWCHMFNSTLVGNARNWFSKLPRRSIDGFEELRRAFRLNFTQRKKCAKNPVELARVKQRQGESTSAYVERYKDECIHVKACPEILKISGFMNGINNPELIKRLNDRVPQTFDELMKRTRSFIQGEAAAADSRKGYSNNRSQEQSRRQSNDQSSSRNNSYRGQRGGRGNDKYTPLTMTPKEILATEGANFPRPPPMRTPEEQRVGNGYCEYHRQKGHTTNECVQLRQLIDKLVKEGRLDHLVKNIKEGKDKQRSGGKKDAPRDKADTIYMVQSWQRKTKQKVSQKFSHGSGISFPTLTADNAVVEPLTIEINAAGHDIHRMYIDGGASADILYEHCFQRLRPEVKSQLNPATTSLTGFTGEKIWPMGQLRLPVMVGNKEHSTTAWMNFMVIRSPSPYNGIIRRPVNNILFLTLNCLILMASLNRHLNPLYVIKECSSCGNLHTKDCGCPKGSLEDKILVPIPDLSQRPLKIEKICLDCGDPVHGLYCRQCALIRKTLEEVFQDFQDTSKSSNDAFYSDDDHIKEKSSGSTTTHANFSQYDSFIFDLSINPFSPADRSDFYHEEFADELAHIISPSSMIISALRLTRAGILTMYCVEDIHPNKRTKSSVVPNVITHTIHPGSGSHTLVHYHSSLIYLWISSFSHCIQFALHIMLSCGNENTIFEPPASSNYHSFMPDVSHQSGTFHEISMFIPKPLE
ncbi:reverse transcriptase domain-containing protein [Tanacetum coccineum]